MLETVMGFEGGNHPVFDLNFQGVWNAEDELPQDDPFATVRALMPKAMMLKIDENLWETEEIKPSEVPEELKESGAINVSLRDVKNSIGKNRAG